MKDTKIYLITCNSEIYKNGYPTGRKETVVSHGVGNNTLENHILPCDPLRCFDYKEDHSGYYIEIGE